METASAIRSREWRENNREKYLEGNRRNANAWYAENRARALAYRAVYRATKKDLVREQLRRWRQANKEYQRAHTANRRTVRKQAPGKFTAKDVQFLFAKQNGFCVYCKSALDKFHVDHIKPFALGGDNFPANLQLLCPDCNMSKGAKDPIEFAQQRGLLL